MLLIAAAGRAQSADTLPPLATNEYAARVAGGCLLVFHLPANHAADYVATQQKRLATAGYRGPCQYGLATGTWTYGTGEFFFAYGRELTKRVVERAGGWHEKATVYRVGDTAVSIPKWDDPYAAKWDARAGGEAALEGTTQIIRAFETTCGDYPAVFKDCGADVNKMYDVYGVKIGRRTDPRTSATTWGKTENDSVFWCPTPRTTEGCAALWHEKAAPVIAEITRFIARAAAQDSALVRILVDGNAKWIAAHPGPVVAASPAVASSTTAGTPTSSPPSPSASATTPAPTGPASVVPPFTEPGARVTVLEGPATSRASCVRLSWITAYRKGVPDLPSTAFGDWTHQSENGRALIATNECGEPIYVTGLTCVEDRMTEPSSAKFLKQHPTMKPWDVGAMRGMFMGHNTIVFKMSFVSPGQSTFFVATKDHVRRPGDNPDERFESSEKLIDLLYGAWVQSDIYSTTESKFTPAGDLILRKRLAVLTAYNEKSAHVEVQRVNGVVQNGATMDLSTSWPGNWSRRIDNCLAADLPGAWSTAR